MSTRDRRALTSVLPDVLVEHPLAIFVQSVGSILLLWWLVAAGLGLTDTISSPGLVTLAAFELAVSLEWIPHLVATLRRTLLGFVVTVVVGGILGIVMGVSDFWEAALQDYVIVGLALPSLFAVVFAAMWFAPTGLSGDAAATVASAMIAFPFVTQNVYEAVENIDADLIEMAEAFDVSRGRVLRRIVLQSIMPAFFAGARYAFSICWKITTLAELIVANVGIGYMIGHQMELRSITGVITWTLLFTMVILVIEYGVLQQIENRVFEWRQQVQIGW